jgi:hypothetical protein
MPPRRAPAAAAAAPKSKAKPAAPVAAAAAVPKANGKPNGKAKGKGKAAPEPEPEEEEEEEEEDEQFELEDGEEDEEGEDGEDDEEDGEDDEEEDDEDEDGAGPLADLGPVDLGSLMSMIASMKQQSGPIVTAVHLRADGTSAQVTLDMTPKEDAVGKLLGGKATFVGSYPAPLEGVVMSLQDAVAKKMKSPVNKHVLPPPYDRDAGTIRGDLVVLRMDKDSNPASITLEEFEQYKANPEAAVAAASKKGGAKKGGVAAAAAAAPASGKKQGMSTEQAAALARSKRKSMGMPEPADNLSASEPEDEPKAKRAKKVAAPAAAATKRK